MRVDGSHLLFLGGDITRFAGIPTEEPQKLSAVKYLNKLLGRHHTSTLHWRLLKRALLFKFAVRYCGCSVDKLFDRLTFSAVQKCLLDHELDDGYDLRKRISVTKLFKRLQKLAPNIFVLTEEARKVCSLLSTNSPALIVGSR